MIIDCACRTKSLEGCEGGRVVNRQVRLDLGHHSIPYVGRGRTTRGPRRTGDRILEEAASGDLLLPVSAEPKAGPQDN
jgi:hypothetical protein